MDGQRPSKWRVIAAYLRRVMTLLGPQKPDILWIERELLPWMPWTLERLLLGRRIPTILDLDDSIYHRYDLHPSGFVRKFLGHRVDRAMAAATVVTCGNPTIAARARESGARRIVELPTVIDLTRYPPEPAERPPNEFFTIGWIGSPQNSPYLDALRQPLTQLAAESRIRILVVGGRPDVLKGLPVEVRPWSEETEVAALCEMDIGIMPLPDLPFERGKCGLKLLQYMAAWKPAIASPVGINAQIIDVGIGGFVANGPDEWLSAFRRLRDDPELRRSMGQSGRRHVERAYSLEHASERLIKLIRGLVPPHA
ncbi:MAG TPA: glycosyltransferase [Aliidongia sp.]|uniref:glycosyltransferase n=1 Tax=Aliidongia sp. TaxID=1914230 RepID=UPI002DDCDB67|nr:glycosyltransferase [Aliidongia sp.]HEV2676086.1 glycosyltransferase [Aliidongia sp.]